MILAGDIGGTKTVLALFERDPVSGRLEERRSMSFASAQHDSLESVVSLFLASGGRPGPGSLDVACFGVAGAVLDGSVSATNLPWSRIDVAALSWATGARRVELLNDLAAAAYGMLVLPDSAFAELNPAAHNRTGSAAVIAAGTGLGEAQLIWDGRQHIAVAGEGGHADFAPRGDQEFALLRHLRQELGGRVSWERILSGPGLRALYDFVRVSSPEPEPRWLAERFASEDPSAVVSEVAHAGGDPVCRAAMELFASIYGAEAGNMALRSLAVGGVFLAGGIAPKILPALQTGSFMQAFTDKGRFSELMRSTPVRVALDDRAPLLGAAHYAERCERDPEA